jgi:D-tyrosyl-tRNA(Tyr) deacylase
MRVILQRVSSASVSINKQIKSEIGSGLLILLGVETTDNQEDMLYLCRKIVSLRIFNDADDKMNLSITDIGGQVLLISQFTLFAQSQKGNRPSYTRAARPEVAIPLYEEFIKTLSDMLGKPVLTGEFGADMKVSLLNDGPVTIIMDSRQRDY